MTKELKQKAKDALLQFGLTKKEIATYIVLLQKGACSVQAISKYTGINRVSTYAAIEILKKRNLIIESKTGKRTLFLAEDPESLKEILDQKKQELKKAELSFQNVILPNLKNLNREPVFRPKISFYEGVAGVSKTYDEYILNSKSKYLIGCGSYDSAVKATSWKDEKWFFNQIKKKKLIYKAILEDTPLNRDFADLGKGVMHVKYLPVGTKVTADIHAFGSFVSLTSYDTLVTTIIEEESIAESIRIYLEFMWDRLG
jgi:sugar-specific transcriptional regulator TrmB